MTDRYLERMTSKAIIVWIVKTVFLQLCSQLVNLAGILKCLCGNDFDVQMSLTHQVN